MQSIAFSIILPGRHCTTRHGYAAVLTKNCVVMRLSTPHHTPERFATCPTRVALCVCQLGNHKIFVAVRLPAVVAVGVAVFRCMPTLWSLAGSWGSGKAMMTRCHAFTSLPTVTCSPAPGTAQSSCGSKHAQPPVAGHATAWTHLLGKQQLACTSWHV